MPVVIWAWVAADASLSQSDAVRLQTAFSHRSADTGENQAPSEIVIHPGDFVWLAGQDGIDDALLGRLARDQGRERWFGYVNITVDALARDGTLSAADLLFMRVAFDITPKEIFTLDDYRSLEQRLTASGISDHGLLTRLTEASRQGARVAGVLIDLGRPLPHEVAALAARCQFDSVAFPDSFAGLARAVAAEREPIVDTVLLRRLVAADGKKIAGTETIIHARLTAPEIKMLIATYGGTLSDARLDAQDADEIAEGLERSSLAPLEKEIWLARLLLFTGTSVMIIDGKRVSLVPRQLTTHDLDTLRDVWGIEIADGHLSREASEKFKRQIHAQQTPTGLDKTLSALRAGQPVSEHAAQVLRAAVLRSDDTILRQRYAALPAMPWDSTSASDQAVFDRMQKILSQPPGPATTLLALRLNDADGRSVTTADGESVQVGGDPPLQALYERRLDATLGGGQFIFTLNNRETLSGFEWLAEVRVRDDGRGAGGRTGVWLPFPIPVLPGLSAALWGNAGASFQQPRLEGGKQDRLNLEADGGGALAYRQPRWSIDLRSYWQARFSAWFSENGPTAAIAAVDAYASDIYNLAKSLNLQSDLAPIQDVQAAVVFFTGTVVGLITGFAADPSLGSAESIQKHIQDSANAMINAIVSSGHFGQHELDFIKDAQARTNEFIAQITPILKAIASRQPGAPGSTSAGWGTSFGTSLNTAGSFPLVSGSAGTLSLRPSATVAFLIPIKSTNELPGMFDYGRPVDVPLLEYSGHLAAEWLIGRSLSARTQYIVSAGIGFDGASAVQSHHVVDIGTFPVGSLSLAGYFR